MSTLFPLNLQSRLATEPNPYPLYMDKSSSYQGDTITVYKGTDSAVPSLTNVSNVTVYTNFDLGIGVTASFTLDSATQFTFTVPTLPNTVGSNNYCMVLVRVGATVAYSAGTFLLSSSSTSAFSQDKSVITPMEDVTFNITNGPLPGTTLLTSDILFVVLVDSSFNISGVTFNVIDPSSLKFTINNVGTYRVFFQSNYEPGYPEYTNYMYAGTIVVNSPVICFKEDSKILCLKDDIEQEIFVQNLQIGDLVKTVNNGFLPLKVIGKSSIQNIESNERSRKRLYKLSKEKYPELNEDLYLTGCHSILVDEITDKQRDVIKSILGVVYVTDNKYRLLVCADEKAEPYKDNSLCNIYHIAIGEDKNRNYGVFANGLLVETCFEDAIKRKMKEFK